MTLILLWSMTPYLNKALSEEKSQNLFNFHMISDYSKPYLLKHLDIFLTLFRYIEKFENFLTQIVRKGKPESQIILKIRESLRD
jgi:hypothetical protein